MTYKKYATTIKSKKHMMRIDINKAINQMFKRYLSSQNTADNGMYPHIREEIESLQQWIFMLHDLDVDLRDIQTNKIYNKILRLYEENCMEQAEHAQIWFNEFHHFINDKYPANLPIANEHTHQQDNVA